MSKEDRDAILQAAAKTLAWELYAAAGYSRLRTRINVERFDRELCSAVRQWSATHKNLKERKEQMTVNTTENPRPFWRQGDIFFVKLDHEPGFEHAKPVKTGVITRGEETGHMHRVASSSLADGALLALLGGSMYLRFPEPGTTIVHEEHGTIQLPVGVYAVANQREFDGLRWRTVLD